MPAFKFWYTFDYWIFWLSNLHILSSIYTAHHWKEKNVLDEYFHQKERDLRQVIVLPKAQWERIQGSIREAPLIDEKKEQEEGDLDSKAAGKEDPRNATLVSTRYICKQVAFVYTKPHIETFLAILPLFNICTPFV